MSQVVTQSVIDALTGLHDAESESLLLRLREPLPALARASEHVREILQSLERDRTDRANQLRELIQSLQVAVPRNTGPELDPFLSLLSTRFLLLKVAEAQALLKARYDNALVAMSASPGAIVEQVQRLREQVSQGYEKLERELHAMGLETPPLL